MTSVSSLTKYVNQILVGHGMNPVIHYAKTDNVIEFIAMDEQRILILDFASKTLEMHPLGLELSNADQRSIYYVFFKAGFRVTFS